MAKPAMGVSLLLGHDEPDGDEVPEKDGESEHSPELELLGHKIKDALNSGGVGGSSVDDLVSALKAFVVCVASEGHLDGGAPGDDGKMDGGDE